MVGGDGQVGRLLESVDDVEVGQARLDHEDVGALLDRVGVGVRVSVRVRVRVSVRVRVRVWARVEGLG